MSAECDTGKVLGLVSRTKNISAEASLSPQMSVNGETPLHVLLFSNDPKLLDSLPKLLAEMKQEEIDAQDADGSSALPPYRCLTQPRAPNTVSPQSRGDLSYERHAIKFLSAPPCLLVRP